MIIRAIVKLYRWFTAEKRDYLSDEWMRQHPRTDFDDNPRSQDKHDDARKQ